MSVTRSQAKARAKRQSTKCPQSSAENSPPLTTEKQLPQLRSPLKEVNTGVARDEGHCSPLTKGKVAESPSCQGKGSGGDHTTPTQTLPSAASTPARRKESINYKEICPYVF